MQINNIQDNHFQLKGALVEDPRAFQRALFSSTKRVMWLKKEKMNGMQNDTRQDM